MKDTERGFQTTADELAQVLRAAGAALVNRSTDSDDAATDFYHGVLMGAASAMIMGMRNEGAENTPIEIEVMADDDDDFAEERND